MRRVFSAFSERKAVPVSEHGSPPAASNAKPLGSPLQKLITEGKIMAANNESIKTKKSGSVKRKSTGQSLAKANVVEAQPESQTRMVLEDKKSQRAISSLAGYLGIAVFLNVLILIIQLWATFKAGYVLTSFSLVYLLLSLASIAALIWCIILLNRKNALALWAFVGFILVSFLNTVTLRSYSGKTLFVPLDLVAYIVQTAIFLSIFSLKQKGILRQVE